MNFTQLQKKANHELGMAKVVYRNMWQSEKQLGYTSKGKGHYDINVASDFPNEEVKAIVLMHEVGHIFYGHDDIDTLAELKYIEDLCYALGYSPMDLAFYGGVMHFLNIAMDFEVNTKLLTKFNMKVLKDNGVGGVHPSQMNIPFKETFREYYEPLIKSINPSNLKKAQEMSKMVMEDLSESVSSFEDNGLSDEMKEALSDEQYCEGNSKSASKNVTHTSTVKTEEQSFSKYGTSTQKVQLEEVPIDDKMKSFFKRMMKNCTQRKEDNIKIYNRNTRSNSNGILYTSFRPKHGKDKQKLGIIIDVSGSMELTVISSVLKTLQGMFSSLNADSKLYTWTTELEEEFKITNIPNLVNACGGTDIAKALQFIEGKGFNDVVIFSDFYTNLSELIKETKNCKARVHSIIVDGFNYVDSLKDYTELNESFIVLNDRELREKAKKK